MLNLIDPTKLARVDQFISARFITISPGNRYLPTEPCEETDCKIWSKAFDPFSFSCDCRHFFSKPDGGTSALGRTRPFSVRRLSPLSGRNKMRGSSYYLQLALLIFIGLKTIATTKVTYKGQPSAKHYQ
jgi:hypothetical protein